mmetsp:Transcript_18924/g.28118  ORF Transcript_18924/g.28118 Transcript_18924/m.28118 type:complete len:84 (+) Transcript_18924:290-541(+)
MIDCHQQTSRFSRTNSSSTPYLSKLVLKRRNQHKIEHKWLIHFKTCGYIKSQENRARQAYERTALLFVYKLVYQLLQRRINYL